MEYNFLLISGVTILVLVYYYLKKKTLYWAERGVPFVKPDLLLGNFRGISTKCHAGERWQSCYNELKNRKSPIGGVFFWTAPVAMVVDLDLLKNVFVKDFQYFRNHGTYLNECDDPLTGHMFSAVDDQWRDLRTKLSPTFTSGKMKMMFPTINAVADQFRDHLRELAGVNGSELQIKELLSQYTMDIICNTALGIEPNTMKNPNGEIREISKLIFAPSMWTVMKINFLLQFPELGKLFHIKQMDERVTKFFREMCSGIVKHREENSIQRNDFMHLLLQLKKTGRLEDDNSDSVVAEKLTFNELMAQVFLFFFAGYETSSSTMTFSLYELAKNPDVQERARREIEDVLAKHGGQMTYEAIMELNYIEQIINGNSCDQVIDGMSFKI